MDDTSGNYFQILFLKKNHNLPFFFFCMEYIINVNINQTNVIF